jgi:hypothetical protein
MFGKPPPLTLLPSPIKNGTPCESAATANGATTAATPDAQPSSSSVATDVVALLTSG